MKLIRATTGQFTFRISRREKQFLLQLLQMYPLVPPSHHPLSKSEVSAEYHENQQLLDEAVAEQRRENQKRARSMFEEPARFHETANVIQFSLEPEEIECLLQILNDVRIGAWLKLGEPGELDRPEINQTNTPYFVAMEVTGYFQSELLAALGSSDPAQSREI